jgi:Plavaka transposase
MVIHRATFGVLTAAKSMLDDGDTVVPIIFMSDATHLTNFSGDKKAWPVYMTIGNLSSSARMAPAMHSVLLIALLPIAVKMRDIPLSRYTAQKEHNRMVLQHVLRHILGPLMRPDRRIFYARCADGHFRRCVASPAAWIADYPEHRDLHNIKNGVCYWCECPQSEMGELPAQPYPPRDHDKYRTLSVANSAAANARLARVDVHQGANVFWDLDCVTNDLPKPDLLHTIQLGMLKHLLGWLSEFLKQHKRFEAFNNIWLSVPAYLDMTQPRRAYEEVSSWQGKEIKTMSRFLIGVLRNALRTPSASQRGVFNQAIECSRALVEFYFYSQYESHDEQTLALMSAALRDFHHSKNVFRQFRAGKKITQEGKARRKDLNAERDEELKSTKFKTAAHRERQRKAWNDFIHVEMVEHRDEGGDFNFPKIHQMLHFREQIQRYGCLKQWSTETGESSHRTQIKVPYNKSNRSGDIYSQILEHYLRGDAFAVRKLNRNAASTLKSATSCEPTIPVSHGLKFMSPQNSPAVAKIKTFAGVLASVTDLHLRNELRHATNRFLLSRKVGTNTEALLSCTASVYHGIQVPVTNMHGDRVIQTIRCTGEQTWHNRSPRHDWVWVKTSRPREGHEPAYKALRGRVPYRLLKLFKLDVFGSLYWCAFVEITTPSAGGTPEKASGMVRVTKPTAGSCYAVISGGNIAGAAHLIPEEPVSSGLPNNAWIVNSHIDLATWNEVYYMFENELDQAAAEIRR